MADLPSPSSFGTEPLRIVIREGDETAGSGYDYVSSSSPPQLSKNAMDPQQAYVLGILFLFQGCGIF
ncbi:unnamed protein product [Anisakis simplex]|uniref:Uncharacterized protein n=1 Tax=Anisakis simplex TaxID=6269 RepID=A0A0M3JRJ2_ANISI|nr:unnamed protein product [Anisakis simplex]